MKKTIILFIIVFFTFSIHLKAQPQWKFHVAFEDGIGAKDTIWFIWDTTAVFYGIDTALGEGNPNMNYSDFNVYTLTWDTYPDYDTTKVVAHPYEYTFGHQIEAINFELPVKISWDSALFHADWLPSEPVGWVNYAWISNEYFFLVNNTEDHYFDLTLNDHTIMPDSTIVGTEDENPWFWLPERNFPLGIGLAQDPTLIISDATLFEKDFAMYPNPVQSVLTIESKLNISMLKIYNSKGQCLLVSETNSFPLKIDISDFKPDIYIIQLTINQNHYHYEKIIKIN
jgi:hypothetical protein